MFLHFADKALNIFFLGDIGWNSNGSAFEAFLCGKIVETLDGLVDALFATSFASTDEERFGASN